MFGRDCTGSQHRDTTESVLGRGFFHVNTGPTACINSNSRRFTSKMKLALLLPLARALAPRVLLSERQAQAILDRIAGEGPLTAADFENGASRSGWWEWSHTKHALEWLFWSGKITTACHSFAKARVLHRRQ